MKKIFILLIFSIFCFGDNLIKLHNRPVLDEAGVLSAKTKAYLNKLIMQFDKNSTNQISVVILKSLNKIPIEDVSIKIARELKLGDKEHNNGVLILVAPNEKKVRIEVGYGLEGILTDLVSKKIISSIMIPNFKNDNYNAGIKDGVETIIAILSGTDFKKIVKKHNYYDLFILGAFLIFFFFIILKSKLDEKTSKYMYQKYKKNHLDDEDNNLEDLAITGLGIASMLRDRRGRDDSNEDSGFSGRGGDFGGGGASGSW